jgi:PIN domain nuclease of toxin-antitoxin system
VRSALAAAGAEILPFDEADADQVATLTPAGRRLGPSLGDRACVCLAMRVGGHAVTAERSWVALSLEGLTVDSIR